MQDTILPPAECVVAELTKRHSGNTNTVPLLGGGFRFPRFPPLTVGLAASEVSCPLVTTKDKKQALQLRRRPWKLVCVEDNSL